ncbi:Hsp20/alpha crystallin family protein [Theileria parva strain Muguga]|uniref:Small heat shock protein, putative n=1 Tax=Theileria parva TaxID=5875 RepID=Q4N318_THEPA|nr:Hsp20/alpha crystallin family protein [Theileria parva strain Muguga]EAN31521.1 Hsp20/alpha crystallin family protein [Theileria parva strain Muguga]|eukprot:XP_763804.1 small heat shock protein [Theileria parva strain Muguga]
MSCILKCNDTNDEIIVGDIDNYNNKTYDYVEKPSVMYKPSTVVPPNNILEITPPKDLEYPITFYPTVDTFFDKDNNNLVTLMELPGFPISDIEINIGDGEMIVSGPRPKEELYEKFGENLNIQIRERKVGYFYRRFKLPNNAMDNTASACYDNGILSIIIECSQFNPIRRLEITNTPNYFINNKKNNINKINSNSIDNNNDQN